MIDMLLEVTPTYVANDSGIFSRSELDDDTARIFDRLNDIE